MSDGTPVGGFISDRQPFPGWWRGQDGRWYPQKPDGPDNDRFPSRRPSRLRTSVIVCALVAVVVVCVGGMVAYMNTAGRGSGSVYRVVGAGVSCSGTCPPGVATYTVRLAPSAGSPDDAKEYELSADVQHHNGVAGYPECIFAVTGAEDVQSWEPSEC